MLKSNPEGYLQDVAVVVGDKASLQSIRESVGHFKGPAELNRWFNGDLHAQITADAYNLFAVMINPMVPAALNRHESVRLWMWLCLLKIRNCHPIMP